MPVPAARLVLLRHGETEWSRAGRHTSFTDLPLTERGRAQAAALAPVLGAWSFAAVLCSPRQRARDTASLALPGADVRVDGDLAEWNYGDYEGLTTEQIHGERDAAWNLWRDGCPHGESPAEVAARADRVIREAVAQASPAHGAVDVLCVAHAHVLRVLAARWLGLQAESGALFALDTASLSVLGHEHGRRVLSTWNADVARTA